MKAKQVKNVIENRKKYFALKSRTELQEIIFLVEELLEEELKYLQESEPAATSTISETKIAREVLRNLYHTIDKMDTEELIEENLWTDC